MDIGSVDRGFRVKIDIDHIETINDPYLELRKKVLNSEASPSRICSPATTPRGRHYTNFTELDPEYRRQRPKLPSGTSRFPGVSSEEFLLLYQLKLLKIQEAQNQDKVSKIGPDRLPATDWPEELPPETMDEKTRVVTYDWLEGPERIDDQIGIVNWALKEYEPDDIYVSGGEDGSSDEDIHS